MEDKECCTRPFGVKKTGQNFMMSMANVVKSGGKHVTEEVRQERIRLCESCEHFQGKTRQCGICRCFLDLKTRFSTEECPIGRW